MSRLRRWKRRLLVLAVSLSVVYALGWMIGIRGLLEARLFYYPSREHFLRAPTAEEVYFTTADGLRLHGWFFPAEGASPDSPAPALVHCHGNAGNINWHTEFSSFLPREGISVLLFDYRGFGRSDLPPGRLARRDLITDSRAAIEHVLARPDVDPAAVGVYGVSVGGVIGLAAAAEEPRVRAVVSIAAFSTWQGIVADHGGRIAARLIAPGADAAESIARLGDRPVLIIHGTRDQIVPVHHAQRLKDAADRAGTQAELIVDPGADHNDIVFTSRDLQLQIGEWLGRNLRKAPEGTGP
jgi:uncharacterized protein